MVGLRLAAAESGSGIGLKAGSVDFAADSNSDKRCDWIFEELKRQSDSQRKKSQKKKKDLTILLTLAYLY